MSKRDQEKPNVARRSKDGATLAKKFYTTVAVGAEAPHAILLDGRAVKTPKKRALQLPKRSLADAIAAEWSSQQAVIDPHSMPLTRFANSAIDVVQDNADAVAADIVAYAGNDLVCYRASEPLELITAEARHWDPVLAWAWATLNARFVCAEGLMPVEQPTEATTRVAAALVRYSAFELAALHVLTTLTGSALLALANAHGAMSADEVWAAAHVDEDHQIAIWGEDAEASMRRVDRRAEFDAAARLLGFLSLD